MGRKISRSGAKTSSRSTPPSPVEIDWDAPHITERLRAAGLRPTLARRRIVALLQALRIHPTVEELQSLLAGYDREIHQATLYQNVAKLAGAGVISSFVDSDGLLRLDAEVESHPHLVCTRCGAIADIEPTEAGAAHLADLTAELSRDHPEWRVGETRIEFRALCPPCSSRA